MIQLLHVYHASALMERFTSIEQPEDLEESITLHQEVLAPFLRGNSPAPSLHFELSAPGLNTSDLDEAITSSKDGPALLMEIASDLRLGSIFLPPGIRCCFSSSDTVEPWMVLENHDAIVRLMAQIVRISHQRTQVFSLKQISILNLNLRQLLSQLPPFNTFIYLLPDVRKSQRMLVKIPVYLLELREKCSQEFCDVVSGYMPTDG